MPYCRVGAPRGRTWTGAAACRQLRADRQQRHLRRDGRGDVLLGLLPRRGRLGAGADVGFCRGRRERDRRCRGGYSGLRLPASLLAPAGDAEERQRQRLRRRLAPPGGAALGLPPLPGQQRRPLLQRRQRGRADAAAAALLHLLPDRRPARRRGPDRARPDRDLQRLEQDRDRRRLPAGATRRRRAGRPHLGAEQGVRRGPRHLRPHGHLRRDRARSATAPPPTSTSPATAPCARRSTPTSATSSPTR